MKHLTALFAFATAQLGAAATLVDRTWSPTRGAEGFASNYSSLPGGRQLHSICADDFTLSRSADVDEVVVFGSLAPHAWYSTFAVTIATEPCGPASFLGLGIPTRQAVGVDRSGGTVLRLTIRFPFAVPLSAGRRYWLSAGPLMQPPATLAFRWSSLKTISGFAAVSCSNDIVRPLVGTSPGGRRDLALVLRGSVTVEP